MNKNVWVTIVPNRRSNTITAVLRLFFAPGSTLYTDGYPSYPRVFENLGVSHFVVNHNETFVTNEDVRTNDI